MGWSCRRLGKDRGWRYRWIGRILQRWSICWFLGPEKESFSPVLAILFNTAISFPLFLIISLLFQQLIFSNFSAHFSSPLIFGWSLAIFLRTYRSNLEFRYICQYIHWHWWHQSRILWFYRWLLSSYQLNYFVIMQAFKENLSFFDSFLLILHDISIHFYPLC